MRKNDGKGTITDTEDGKDVKATKLMEFIEATHPKEAKIGVKIRFIHDLDGTVYWLEGIIQDRLTKYKKAQKLKFAENIFRIGELKIIASWGDEPKILPATVCANLTSNVGWSIGTAVLPEDENSAIEIRPSDIPKSMREDEVDQSEEEETAEKHLDDDETGGISEPLRNISMKNERPGDDASTDFSEISDDE